MLASEIGGAAGGSLFARLSRSRCSSLMLWFIDSRVELLLTVSDDLDEAMRSVSFFISASRPLSEFSLRRRC